LFFQKVTPITFTIIDQVFETMPSTRRAKGAPLQEEVEGTTTAPEQREDDESEEDDDVDDEDESEDSNARKRKTSSPDRNRDKRAKIEWTNKEDDTLLKAVLSDRQSRKAEDDTDDDEESDDDWDEIAMSLPDKSPVQCLQRYLKLNSKPVASKTADDAARKSSGDDSDEKKYGKLDSDRWTSEDVDLLKKLVEAYPDCKLSASRPHFPCQSQMDFYSRSSVTYLFIVVPFLQLHHDGMTLPRTLRIEVQLIV
jgi:hypothetical protein